MHHRVHFALRGGGEGEMGGRGRRAQANSGEAAQDDKKGINKASLSRAGLLVLLLGLYTHNQLTRSSLFFSVNFAAAGGGGASSTEAAAKEFMNVALSFGPSQYALLASYGFTLLYALVSLPAGRAADTHDCAKTLAAASLVWSLALALQGSPWSSFPLVWICRVVQGIAMAFTGPQAISLLADAFPGPKLAFATSFYSTGVYIGGSLASLSMIANARFGWRATFLSISAVGVVMSLGLAAITKGMGLGKREEVSKNEVSEQGRKPGRGGGGGGGGGGGAVSSSSGNSSSKGAISLGLDAAWEVVRCRGIAWLLAATATRFCAGYGIGIWLAPFFRAKFPTMQAQYAVVSALTIGGGGCLSTLAGGVITEKLAAKDRRAVLRVPIIGCETPPKSPNPGLHTPGSGLPRGQKSGINPDKDSPKTLKPQP